jgi:hypothetical protein
MLNRLRFLEISLETNQNKECASNLFGKLVLQLELTKDKPQSRVYLQILSSLINSISYQDLPAFKNKVFLFYLDEE